MAGEAVEGNMRAELLEEVRAALSAIGGKPFNTEQVLDFLNYHPAIRGKIVAFDEVSDSDREELYQLFNADLEEQRKQKEAEAGELGQLRAINILGLVAGTVAALAYLFGFLNFSLVELADLVLAPLMGHQVRGDCGTGSI